MFLYNPEFLELHLTKQTLHFMKGKKSDQNKLKQYVETYGYWSNQVRDFNEVLKQKNGLRYMYELNAPYVGTKNNKR